MEKTLISIATFGDCRVSKLCLSGFFALGLKCEFFRCIFIFYMNIYISAPVYKTCWGKLNILSCVKVNSLTIVWFLGGLKFMHCQFNQIQ